MTVLANLIAPHAAEDFLDGVWGRKMARFPGVPGRFHELLPWDRLNEILGTHQLESPRLRLARSGELVPTVSPHHEMAGLLRDGASLVLDAIDELHPPIGRLAADLEHTLRERVQVNCYASFAPRRAFDTHWDDHEVLVLQVHGRKRWRIFGPTRPHPTHRDPEAPPGPRGEPHADIVLEDGDVLHVPRGWWHDATAVDEPSLHLTFGVTPATGTDLLAWAVDRLHQHELARANLPVHADAETRERHVKALVELLVRELGSPTVLADLVAGRDALAPARGFPSLPWSATGADTDRPVRLLAPRARLEEQGATIRLTAAGQIHTFAAAARPVLRRLLDGAAHTPGELTATAGNTLNQQTVRTLCATLVQLGLVAVAG